MESKKNNTGLIISLVLSIIVIIGLVGYILYDKGIIFKTKEEVKTEEKKNINNEISFEDIEKNIGKGSKIDFEFYVDNIKYDDEKCTEFTSGNYDKECSYKIYSDNKYNVEILEKLPSNVEHDLYSWEKYIKINDNEYKIGNVSTIIRTIRYIKTDDSNYLLIFWHNEAEMYLDIIKIDDMKYELVKEYKSHVDGFLDNNIDYDFLGYSDSGYLLVRSHKSDIKSNYSWDIYNFSNGKSFELSRITD